MENQNINELINTIKFFWWADLILVYISFQRNKSRKCYNSIKLAMIYNTRFRHLVNLLNTMNFMVMFKLKHRFSKTTKSQRFHFYLISLILQINNSLQLGDQEYFTEIKILKMLFQKIFSIKVLNNYSFWLIASCLIL